MKGSRSKKHQNPCSSDKREPLNRVKDQFDFYQIRSACRSFFDSMERLVEVYERKQGPYS